MRNATRKIRRSSADQVHNAILKQNFTLAYWHIYWENIIFQNSLLSTGIVIASRILYDSLHLLPMQLQVESKDEVATKQQISFYVGGKHIVLLDCRKLICSLLISEQWQCCLKLIFVINSLTPRLMNYIRDFGVLAPVSHSNGDFTPIFSTLRLYPRFLETKAPFAPGFNSVS